MSLFNIDDLQTANIKSTVEKVQHYVKDRQDRDEADRTAVAKAISDQLMGGKLVATVAPAVALADATASASTQEHYHHRTQPIVDPLAMFLMMVLLIFGVWIMSIVLLFTRWEIIPDWVKGVSIIFLLPLSCLPPGSSMISLGLILYTTQAKVKSAFY